MGFLTRMFEQRFHPSQDPPTWWTSLSGWTTATGITVTPETALQSTAVFACVRVLAETVASLPLPVYRRLPSGGKERAPDHYLYSILHDQPNPEMTSFEFREVLMGHVVTWGNGFAEIEFDGAGRARALWVLRPDKMNVRRRSGRLEYIYRLPDKVGGREVVLPAERIFHLRGLGFDGLVGYSPIHLARQAVGLAMATEEFGARFFGNGARPGAVMEHPGKLSDEAHERLRKSWEERHQGLEKAHRIAILEEGMKLHEVGIPPEDAQFLETRKFQVVEIARLYRVPPHMIMDLERSTFSNIEHQSIEFVVHTIRPWLVRWEQAIRRDIFLPGDRKVFFAEFLVDGLLRGDVKSRYEAYAVGRQNGWLSANDVRELENMNPIDGGDVYLVPLNMIPAGSAGDFREVPPNREERSAEQRAVAYRRRLTHAQTRVFEDTARRILRREINDVRNAARKHLRRRDAVSFRQWLKEFYDEHHGFIQRMMLPILMAYAEIMGAAAAEEVGSDLEMTPELEQFVSEYTKSYADRHVGSSIGQLKSLLGEAAVAGDDALPAIELRLDEWDETRAEKIARRETVQAGNAVARFVFISVGVIYLRWHAFGESCPYCRALNGRVVGVKETFLEPGVEFQPEGAERPLVTKVHVRHPPAHDGCDCMITAVI